MGSWSSGGGGVGKRTAASLGSLTAQCAGSRVEARARLCQRRLGRPRMGERAVGRHRKGHRDRGGRGAARCRPPRLPRAPRSRGHRGGVPRSSGRAGSESLRLSGCSSSGGLLSGGAGANLLVGVTAVHVLSPAVVEASPRRRRGAGNPTAPAGPVPLRGRVRPPRVAGRRSRPETSAGARTARFRRPSPATAASRRA